MSQTNKIKPIDIPTTLDLALAARRMGKNVIPCYSGDAGVGKSELCQLWVKTQQKRNPKFGFIDLRMAYLEAPDVVGLPRVCSETNRTRHVLPEFWPTDGEGLLLLEEINRANSSVMNTVMQLLTDRKVHNYTLPEGWIIAVPINPETNNYDVNSMDLALRDRLITYNVGYDHKSFVEFIKKSNWHPMLIGFVQSGLWIFKSGDEIGTEGTYISPRTLSRLNNTLLAGLENFDDIFYSTVTSILGTNVGREFYKFVKNVRPLIAQDFIDDEKDSFKRLGKFCDGKDYKGDIVAILLDSLVESFNKFPEVNIDLICKVSHVIAKDQVYQLIMGCIKKSDLKLEDFIKHDPKLKDAVKNSLRG
jgi:hypothetical protein